jgi:GNAT superfamily N-acetyltransferase
MFKAGNQCISTRYKEQLAAFMWIDLRESNCKWYRFPLKGDEAYLFDMFTLKAFRGKGIAPYLRYKSYEILKQMGRTRCYSYTDSFNQAAIKFKKKLNAKTLKTGIYFAVSKNYRWLLDRDTGAGHYRFRSLSKIHYCRP